MRETVGAQFGLGKREKGFKKTYEARPSLTTMKKGKELSIHPAKKRTAKLKRHDLGGKEGGGTCREGKAKPQSRGGERTVGKLMLWVLILTAT